MRRPKSFALVMTLLLVVLLATTGAGLSLTTASERVLVAWVARELDHRLALESFLRLFPELMAHAQTESVHQSKGGSATLYELSFANCRVIGRARPEKGKLQLGMNSQVNVGRLRDLARANDLPGDNIQPLPIQDNENFLSPYRFVWFDQIVAQTEFEEVFPWRIDTKADENNRRRPWSDLVTFWPTDSGTVLGLTIWTTVDSDEREWYVIVRIRGRKIEELFRCSI